MPSDSEDGESARKETAKPMDKGSPAKRRRDGAKRGRQLVLENVPMLDSPPWSSDDEVDNPTFNKRFRHQKHEEIRRRLQQKRAEERERRARENQAPPALIVVGPAQPPVTSLVALTATESQESNSPPPLKRTGTGKVHLPKSRAARKAFVTPSPAETFAISPPPASAVVVTGRATVADTPEPVRRNGRVMPLSLSQLSFTAGSFSTPQATAQAPTCESTATTIAGPRRSRGPQPPHASRSAVAQTDSNQPRHPVLSSVEIHGWAAPSDRAPTTSQNRSTALAAAAASTMTTAAAQDSGTSFEAVLYPAVVSGLVSVPEQAIRPLDTATTMHGRRSGYELVSTTYASLQRSGLTGPEQEGNEQSHSSSGDSPPRSLRRRGNGRVCNVATGVPPTAAGGVSVEAEGSTLTARRSANRSLTGLLPVFPASRTPDVPGQLYSVRRSSHLSLLRRGSAERAAPTADVTASNAVAASTSQCQSSELDYLALSAPYGDVYGVEMSLPSTALLRDCGDNRRATAEDENSALANVSVDERVPGRDDDAASISSRSDVDYILSYHSTYYGEFVSRNNTPAAPLMTVTTTATTAVRQRRVPAPASAYAVHGTTSLSDPAIALSPGRAGNGRRTEPQRSPSGYFLPVYRSLRRGGHEVADAPVLTSPSVGDHYLLGMEASAAALQVTCRAEKTDGAGRSPQDPLFVLSQTSAANSGGASRVGNAERQWWYYSVASVTDFSAHSPAAVNLTFTPHEASSGEEDTAETMHADVLSQTQAPPTEAERALHLPVASNDPISLQSFPRFSATDLSATAGNSTKRKASNLLAVRSYSFGRAEPQLTASGSGGGVTVSTSTPRHSPASTAQNGGGGAAIFSARETVVEQPHVPRLPSGARGGRRAPRPPPNTSSSAVTPLAGKGVVAVVKEIPANETVAPVSPLSLSSKTETDELRHEFTEIYSGVPPSPNFALNDSNVTRLDVDTRGGAVAAPSLDETALSRTPVAEEARLRSLIGSARLTSVYTNSLRLLTYNGKCHPLEQNLEEPATAAPANTIVSGDGSTSRTRPAQRHLPSWAPTSAFPIENAFPITAAAGGIESRQISGELVLGGDNRSSSSSNITQEYMSISRRHPDAESVSLRDHHTAAMGAGGRRISGPGQVPEYTASDRASRSPSSMPREMSRMDTVLVSRRSEVAVHATSLISPQRESDTAVTRNMPPIVAPPFWPGRRDRFENIAVPKNEADTGVPQRPPAKTLAVKSANRGEVDGSHISDSNFPEVPQRTVPRQRGAQQRRGTTEDLLTHITLAEDPAGWRGKAGVSVACLSAMRQTSDLPNVFKPNGGRRAP